MTPTEPPPSPTPKRFEQLVTESFLLYRQSFALLVGTMAIGALVSSLVQATWSPESVPALVAWATITLVPVIIAQAAVTAMAWRAEHQRPVHLLDGYLIALGIAPIYVPGILLLLLILGVTIPAITSVLGLPIGALGLFLLTRWSLFSPLVIVEQRRAVDAFRTSSDLVKGQGWRTLGMFLAVWGVVFFISVLVGYVTREAPLGSQIVLSVVIQATTIPLANVFTLLVYEDYRRLQPALPPNSPEPSTPPDSTA